MDMDLPDIGSHCEAHLCGDRDFLPIKCPGCQKVFCRHHSSLDAHSCPSLAFKSITPGDETTSPRRDRCFVTTCQKPTLESMIVDTTEPEKRVIALCANCAQAFCAIHRHPTDHACPKIPVPTPASEKNIEARRLLEKNFPSTSSKTPSSAIPKLKPKKLPTDPKKLARLRAVELMKMRHHAIPADPRDKNVSMAPSERLHLKVQVKIQNGSGSSGATDGQEKSFWLRKTVGAGRALDMIADQFAIKISDSNPAHFEKLVPGSEDDPVRLRNDELLAKQVEDGETIYLVVGSNAVDS
ncbi:hypothetical protein M422DRAFT_778200 [Sphaerobolus stellatus SS14]|nr:hypothetical protein M422DRAFT_778200 [Sphaerobolus stellatus SS14]